MLWTLKYIPKDIKEIQGQNLAVNQLLNYIKNFKKGKAVILYGPSGAGKTSSVYAIANELNLELIEINASDVRDSESIKERVGNAINQVSLFFKNKIILVDEIDGISGNADKGGISEITKLIDITTFPIVITANDPFDQKFATIRKKAELIEFHRLNYISILNVLKTIAEKENIEYDINDLSTLARRSGGDLRAAITDFQVLTENSKKLLKQELDELSGRRQSETIINALMRIFKTMNPEIALSSLEEINEETDEIFLWIDENLPREYKKSIDLKKAYDNLSLADVYRGRIKRWQYWRFLAYINELLTAGIALSKDEKYHGYNKYIRTTRLLNLWMYNQRNAKKRGIAEKLAKKTHNSIKNAYKEIEYLKIILKNKKDKKIIDYLELEKDEIDFLLK